MTENPVRRLRKLSGFNTVDFCHRLDMSGTALGYIETGQLSGLGVEMIADVHDMAMESGVSISRVLDDEYNGQDLETAYHTWQANERVLEAYRFREVMPRAGTVMPSRSPFAYFVDDVASSRQQFCRWLKVPSSQLSRYIKGATATMPRVIRLALGGVRYPYIDELVDLQAEWSRR